MRFLVINHDHPQFQRWFYSTLENVESKSYDELMALRYASLFGLAGFYSTNLRSLGYEAWDVRVNDEILQKAWARENGAAVGTETAVSSVFGVSARIRRRAGSSPC
jgi:hypothetical protein